MKIQFDGLLEIARRIWAFIWPDLEPDTRSESRSLNSYKRSAPITKTPEPIPMPVSTVREIIYVKEPSKPLEFTETEDDGVKTVEIDVVENFGARIAGEASINMYREIRTIFKTLKVGDRLILDFTRIAYVDSSCLGAMVAINSCLLKQKSVLAIKNPPHNLIDLFKVTNLDRIFKII